VTRWFDVGAPGDLKFTPGAAVKVADRWVALFAKDGGYRAIDNLCPHAGAPLCDGSVLDGKVVCFLHCWEFDLDTGACDVGPQWAVATYPVRERGGRLEVGLPEA
jgi:nitrite reductase/ring-hydroxylating ferredoxin subunit